MVGVTTVVVVAVLFVFHHMEIRAQPTIDSSSEDDSCSQLEEEWNFQVGENNHLRSALENERQKMAILENASSAQVEENHRLKLDNERLRLKTRPVTAKLIVNFDNSGSQYGITIVQDKIYVIHHTPNRIEVFDDLILFPFVKSIVISDTNFTKDIVYSNKSKSVYISDGNGQCIWEMTTTNEHRLTKWMTNVGWPLTLSLSNEGHLLLLRNSQSSGQDILEIYALNATLVRTIQLPRDFKDSEHVVQTSTGNFIIVHRLNSAPNAFYYVISELTTDGQLVNRFSPKNQSEEINRPSDLALDSDNNRLFVADYRYDRVILFDSSDLTWGEVFMSKEIKQINPPWRLFYDSSKKRLFVAQPRSGISVFEIN